MRVKGRNPHELLDAKDDFCLSSFLQVAALKRLYRQGWLKRDVPEDDCESVADHTFGVAMLALLAPAPDGLDRAKAAVMALIHELGEVYAGDITPVDGISLEEKARLEGESIDRVLADHPRADLIRALWDEFEEGSSPEACFVRQLDRLELGIQASTYRAEGRPRMEEFLASADKSVRDEELRTLLRLVADPSRILS